MGRTRAIVLKLLAASAAVGLTASAAFAGSAAAASATDARVDHQGWAQTSAITTFTPAANEIYVAMTAGIEEARSFVHLDTTGLTAADLTGAKLELHEAADSLMPASAAMVACALTQPFNGDGKITGTAPTPDCTLRTDATRDVNGTWSVPLTVFADAWGGGADASLVLFPASTATAASFRVAMSTDKTALAGVAPPAATTDTTTPGATEPNAAPAGPIEIPTQTAFQPLGVFTPTQSTIAPTPPTSVPSVTVAQPTVPRTAPRVASAPPKGRSTTGSSVLAMAVLAAIAVALGALVRRRAPSAGGAPSGIGSNRPGSMLAPALGAIALVLVPLLGREVIVFKVGVVLIFFVAAIGLHVLVNWAGQLSLAHAAMVGMPAYMTLTLSQRLGMSPIYLLPVSLLLGALVGAVIAIPTLRAKDLQVALVTLVAGIAIDRFFFAQSWLVGGAGGRAAAAPELGPLHITTSRSLYPVLAVVVIAAILGAWALMHSKFARAWFWVRSDPDAASAFGVPVTAYRIGAYAVGGAFAGLAGGLTVMWIQRLGATAFPDTLSFSYLLIAVLSGPGFVGGLAAATFMLEGGQQFATNIFGNGGGKTVDTILTYGGPLGLISVIAQYQEGFNGLGRRLMPRIRGAITMRRSAADGDARTEVPLAVIAGVTIIVAGFLAMALAWRHISRTNQLWVQNQEILSGGLTGLALVLVGVGLLIRDRLVRNQLLLAEQLERLFANQARSADADATSTTTGARDGRDVGGTDETDAFVAVPPVVETKPATNGRSRRRQATVER